SSRMRPVAKRFAGGIIGSFPGVFVFQIFALPIFCTILFLLWQLSHFTNDLHGFAQIIWAITVVVFTFGFLAVASMAGFLVGWRVGFKVASGVDITTAMMQERILLAL